MSEDVSTADFGRGAHALRQFRDATSDICDVIVSQAQEDFRLASRTVALGNALLVRSTASPLSYDRTAKHVARDGMDHYHVTLCLDGEAHFSSGRRRATLRRGDLCLFDMGQPNHTSLIGDDGDGPSRLLSIVLPRGLLAPLLASPDSATGSLLPRDSLQGRLVADQLFAFDARGDGSAETAASVNALAGAVAEAVGKARDADAVADRAQRHLLLAAVKRHIDAHLQTGAVSVEKLCRRFQLSRATLYRLFEGEGGLSRYVQELRLNRAFMRLASTTAPRARTIDLAIDFQFSSDATFVRAFRRQFGLTPGEVWRLARARAALSDPGEPAVEGALAWMRRLGER